MAGVAQSSLTNFQVVRDRPGAGRVAGFLAAVRQWQRLARQRRELARLDARELADFGANSADVWRELNAPFWRSMPPC